MNLAKVINRLHLGPNHFKKELEKTFLCTSGGMGDTTIKIWDL